MKKIVALILVIAALTSVFAGSILAEEADDFAAGDISLTEEKQADAVSDADDTDVTINEEAAEITSGTDEVADVPDEEPGNIEGIAAPAEEKVILADGEKSDLNEDNTGSVSEETIPEQGTVDEPIAEPENDKKESVSEEIISENETVDSSITEPDNGNGNETPSEENPAVNNNAGAKMMLRGTPLLKGQPIADGWQLIDGYYYYYIGNSPVCNQVYVIDGYMYGFDENGRMLAGRWYQFEEWYHFESNGKGTTGWAKDSTYWYYCEDGRIQYKDDVYYINDIAYAFDADGHMVTGWYNYNKYGYNYWCYFDSNGKGHNGWVKDSNWYYLQNGQPYIEGLHLIDDAIYCFASDGHMLTGWQLVNGWDGVSWYHFESNGKGTNGWAKDSKYWYYCEDGRTVKDSLYLVNGCQYMFDSSGRMLTGWQQCDGEWYHFDSNGKGTNGWAKDSKYWYYCTNGDPYKDGICYDINGHTYFFDENGHMLTGWQKVVYGESNYEWYYFDSDGKGHNGYLTYNNKLYFIEDGYMIHGDIHDCDGTCYEIGDNGVLGSKVTGWKKYYGEWYYANSDGSTFTGWTTKDGKTCFVYHSWMVHSGVYECNGYMNAFADDGSFIKKVTGWYNYRYTAFDGEVVNDWYYATSDGKRFDGWLKYNNKWYYIEFSDVIQNDLYSVDGSMYYFAGDGQMMTGWQKLDNWHDGNYEWYFFDSNGKGHNGWAKDSTYWYYCSDGSLIRDGMIYLESYDAWYCFDNEGRMLTGWHKLDPWSYGYNEWYFFESSGRAHEGIAKDSSHTYFCIRGEIQRDYYFCTEDGDFYCDSNGYVSQVSD